MTTIAELLAAPGTEFEVLPDGRRLINAGQSQHGASKVEVHVRCPRLYAFKYLMNGRQRGSQLPPTSAPLAKGSLLHVGLAHWYEWLRWRATGCESSFETYFLSGPEAIEARARIFIDRERVLERDVGFYAALAQSACRAYVDKYLFETVTIVGVEQLFEVDAKTMQEVTGDSSCPPFTTRIDLVVKNQSDMVYWWDHKSTSQGMGADRYTLAGGVLSKEWLGHRLYGAQWGGVRINMIGWQNAKPKFGPDGTPVFNVDDATFKFQRYATDPAPYAVSRWPHDYAAHWRRLRVLEAGLVTLNTSTVPCANHRQPQGVDDTRSITLDTTLDPWHYPGADSEQVCETKYGKCEMLELCKMGPPVVREVESPGDEE